MGEVNTDRTGVEVLDFEDCLSLLRSSVIGRVGFVADGEVVVLPVTYGMQSDSVVFRSANGEKLHAAVLAKPCAFEIDGWDATTRTGWSVLVKGTAQEVWRDDEVAELEALGVTPWAAPEARKHWIRIDPLEITGRRVGPAPA